MIRTTYGCGVRYRQACHTCALYGVMTPMAAAGKPARDNRPTCANTARASPAGNNVSSYGSVTACLYDPGSLSCLDLHLYRMYMPCMQKRLS